MRPSENSCVVDASAVLALLLDEPGANRVAAQAANAAISAVKIAEVVAELVESGMTAIAIESSLVRLGLQVIDFDGQQAMQTGLLRAPTRHLGLALGDRACLSLARQLQLPALTSDRKWLDLDMDVEVQLIR